MDRFRRLVASLRPALLLAGALAAGNPAAAAEGWTLKGRGDRTYAEVGSRQPGGRLVVACDDTLRLLLYVTRAWDGSRLDPTFLDIDGERLRVTVDGLDSAVALSDLPNEAVGVTPALLGRLKSGKVIQVRSPAARAVPPGQVSFALEGASAPIAEVERACGRRRRG